MLAYDMPLYRPPSEANNLIIQATIGCSFNRCSFCSMYKEKSFRARPLDEVFAEIDRAAGAWPDAHRVFVADGDALGLPMESWRALLEKLDAAFPRLQRVSCYATPINLLKKDPGDLEELRHGKLRLVYVGVESGCDDILKRITKGASQRSIVRALSRARDSGIKTSATVILGLGGRHRWREHIRDTVALVNRAPPTYLSTLQLVLEENVAAEFAEKFGEPFAWQDDEGVLAEQEHLIAGLDPPRPVIFRSNHATNCLALAGTLPKDRDRLLAEIAEARSGTLPLRPRFLRGL